MIEKELKQGDVIVSSTDTRGVITYANKIFCDISEYTKEELYGKSHNIIRDKSVPKAIFKFLWDELHKGKQTIAFIKNITKDKKKFWWVKASIYPVSKNGQIIHYTSYRTKPTKYAVEQIEKIYQMLCEFEQTNSIEKSLELFKNYLKQRNLTYEQFINRINTDRQVLNGALLDIDTKQLKIDHILFRSNIISLVNKQIDTIEVTKPTCCAFGKKLAALESEDFAKDERFLTIKKIHNEIHFSMEAYIDADIVNKKKLLDIVQQDIEKIFTVLNDLKDNYK